MAILTVRNVPDDVHRALRVRAAQHGRSTEAEVREILATAVKPEERVRVGKALATSAARSG
jgi:plasmid stability protein